MSFDVLYFVFLFSSFLTQNSGNLLFFILFQHCSFCFSCAFGFDSSVHFVLIRNTLKNVFCLDMYRCLWPSSLQYFRWPGTMNFLWWFAKLIVYKDNPMITKWDWSNAQIFRLEFSWSIYVIVFYHSLILHFIHCYLSTAVTLSNAFVGFKMMITSFVKREIILWLSLN